MEQEDIDSEEWKRRVIVGKQKFAKFQKKKRQKLDKKGEPSSESSQKYLEDACSSGMSSSAALDLSINTSTSSTNSDVLYSPKLSVSSGPISDSSQDSFMSASENNIIDESGADFELSQGLLTSKIEEPSMLCFIEGHISDLPSTDETFIQENNVAPSPNFNQSLHNDDDLLLNIPAINASDSLKNGDQQSVSTGVSEYSRKIQEYQIAINDRDKIIKQLSDRLKATIEARNCVETENDDQTDQLAAEIHSLKLQLEQASNILKKQKDKTGVITADDLLVEKQNVIRLEQKNIQREKIIASLTNQLTKKEKDFANYKSQMESQAADLANQISLIKSECNKHVIDKQTTTNQIQELMKEVEMLHKQLHDTEKSKKIVEEKLNCNLDKQRSELDEFYGNQITSIKDEMRKSFNDETLSLRDEITNLKEKLMDVTDVENVEKNFNVKIASIRQEHENEKASLKSQLYNYSIELQELNSEYEHLKRSNEQYEAEISQFNDKSRLSLEQIEELNKQLSDEQTVALGLRKELESSQRNFDIAEKKIDDKCRLISELESKVSESELVKERLVDLERMYAEETDVRSRKQKELDSVNLELAEIRAKNAQKSEIVSDLESKLQNGSKELDDVSNRLNIVVNESAEKSDQLKATELEISNLKNELKNRNDVVTELEYRVGDVHSLRIQLDDANVKLSEIELDNSVKNQELNSKESESLELKKKLGENSSCYVELESKVGILEGQLQKVTKDLEERDSINNDLEFQLHSRESSENALKNELKLLQSAKEVNDLNKVAKVLPSSQPMVTYAEDGASALEICDANTQQAVENICDVKIHVLPGDNIVESESDPGLLPNINNETINLSSVGEENVVCDRKLNFDTSHPSSDVRNELVAAQSSNDVGAVNVPDAATKTEVQVLADRLEIETQKQAYLQSQISQLTDMCDSYHVVQLELKTELENTKEELMTALKFGSRTKSGYSTSNVDTTIDDNESVDCTKNPPSFEADLKLRDMMLRKLKLDLREQQIELKHIINAVKLDHQKELSSLKAKHLEDSIDRINKVKDEMIERHSGDLCLQKKQLEDLFNNEIIRIERAHTEQIKVLRSEQQKSIANTSVQSNDLSSAGEACFPVYCNREHLSVMKQCDELVEWYNKLVEAVKATLLPAQLEDINDMIHSFESSQIRISDALKSTISKQIQTALEEERLRLRLYLESTVESVKLQKEAETNAALVELQEKLSKEHVVEMDSAAQKFEEQIEELKLRLEQNNSSSDDNHDVGEDASKRLKEKYNEHLSNYLQNVGVSWESKCLLRLATLKELIEDRSTTENEADESSLVADKLLKEREELIKCAEDVRQFIDAINCAESNQDIGVGVDQMSDELTKAQEFSQSLETQFESKILEMQLLKESNDSDISKMEHENEDKINAIKQQHKKEMADFQKRLNKQSEIMAMKDKKLQEEVGKVTSEVEEKYEQEIHKLREYYEEKLSNVSVIREWSEDLSAASALQFMNPRQDEQIEEERQRFQNEIENLNEQHKRDMHRLDSFYKSRLEEIKNLHNSQLQSLKEEYDNKMMSTQIEYAAETHLLIQEQNDYLHQQLSEKFNQTLNQERQNYVKEMDERYKEAIAMSEDEKRQRIAECEERCARDVELLTKKHCEELESEMVRAQANQERAIEELKSNYQKEVKELEENFKTKAEYDLELQSIRDVLIEKECEVTSLALKLEQSNENYAAQINKVDEMKKEHRAEIEKIRENNAKSVDSLRSNLMQQLDSGHRQEVERLKKESDERFLEVQKKLSGDLEDKYAEIKRIGELNDQQVQQYNQAVEERDNYKCKCDELNSLLKVATDGLEAKDATILEVQEDADKKLKDEIDRVSAELNGKHRETVAAMNIDAREMQSDLETAHMSELSQLKDDHVKDFMELEAKHRSELESLRVKHETKLQELIENHRMELQDLDARIENASSNLRTELECDHRREIDELKSKHREEIDLKESEIIKDYETKLATAAKENDAKLLKVARDIRADVEAKSKVELDELRSKYKQEVEMSIANSKLSDRCKEDVMKNLGSQFVKLKKVMESEKDSDTLKRLFDLIVSLQEQLETTRKERNTCKQQLDEKIKCFDEVVTARDCENDEVNNLISTLQNDSTQTVDSSLDLDTLPSSNYFYSSSFDVMSVQQSNAHLMHILSELVRTFISIEDIINRQLKDQPKPDQNSNKGDPDQSLDATDELAEIVEFNEEGLQLMPDGLSEENFRGPSIDLVCEDVIFGVGKRVYVAVEKLLAMIPSCGSESIECIKCVEIERNLNEQLQQEIKLKELLALDLHEAKGLVSGYEAEKLDLEIEQQNLNEKMRTLTVDLDRCRHQVKELSLDKQHLTTQMQTVTNSLSDIEKKLIEENNKLNESKKTLERGCERRVENLTAKIRELEATSEEQSAYYENLIDKKNCVINDLERQIEAMEKQVKADKNFIEELTCEREQERDEFQKEVLKLHDVITEKEKFQNMDNALTKEVEALEQQLFDKMMEQSQRDVHKSEMIAKLKTYESKLSETNDTILNLETQLEQKLSSEQRLKQELERIRIVLSRHHEVQEELNSEIVYLRQSSVSPSDDDKESNSRLNMLQDQVRDLQNSNSLFEDFKAQMQAIQEKLDNKIGRLRVLNSSAKSGNEVPLNCSPRAERHITVRSPSTDDVHDLSSPDLVHRLDEKIESLISFVDDILSAADDLKSRLEQTKLAEEELFQDKQQLQTELDNQRIQLSALKSSIQHKQEQLLSPIRSKKAIVEEQLAQESKFRNEAEDKVMELAIKLDVKEKEATKCIHKLTEQLNVVHQKNSVFENEIDHLRGQLSSAHEMSEISIKDKNTQIGDLRLRVKSLEEKMADSEDVVENRVAEVKNLVETLEVHRRESKDTVSRLERQLESTTKQMEDIRSQLAVKDHECQQIDDRFEKAVGNNRELNQQLSEADSKYQDVDVELRVVKDQLSTTKMSLQDSVMLCDDLKCHASKLQAKLDEKDARETELSNCIDGLKDEIKRADSRLQTTEERHRREIDRLKDENDLKIKEMEEEIVKSKATGTEASWRYHYSSIESKPSTSITDTTDSTLIPSSLRQLLVKIQNHGLQILTTSELQTLNRCLIEDESITQSQDGRAKETSLLQSQVDKLKLLLSQASSNNEKFDKMTELIGEIFRNERTMLLTEIESRLSKDDGCGYKREYDRLRLQLNALENHQTSSLEKLLEFVQQLELTRATATFVDCEKFYDEKRKLTKQIAALELNSSNKEWKMNREIEYLKRIVEKETLVASNTKRTLDTEKAKTIELTSEVNKQKNLVISLNVQLSNVHAECSTLRQDFQRNMQELQDIRSLYSSEKSRNLALVQSLEVERANFCHLQETVRSERRLSRATEARNQRLIRELHVSAKKVVSSPDVHGNATSGPLSVDDSDDDSISIEMLRKDSRNGDSSLRIQNNSGRRVLDSPIDPPRESGNSVALDASDRPSIERNEHQNDREKMDVGLRHIVESNKKEKESSLTRIKDAEIETLRQTCGRLERELASNNRMHGQQIRESNVIVDRLQRANQLIEIKYEEQRHKMRECEMEITRKDKEIEIAKMKISDGQEREENVAEELNVANDKLRTLLSADENEIPKRLEMLRHKLMILVTKCRQTTGKASRDEFSSILDELKCCEVNSANYAETDFARKVLDHNSELTSLVSNLSGERMKQRDLLVRLEEQLLDIQQNRDASAGPRYASNNVERLLSSERSAWALEQAQLHLSLHKAEADVHKLKALLKRDNASHPSHYADDFKRLYTKYLRSQSYRKALVYQKKYLLILLGGYQDTEKATLSMIAKMGAFPTASSSDGSKILDASTQSRTGIVRFRSAATVVIAICRMKYLVQRWNHISRTGNAATRSRNRLDRASSLTSNSSLGPAEQHSSLNPSNVRYGSNQEIWSSSLPDNLVKRRNGNNSCSDTRNCIERLQYLHHALGLPTSTSDGDNDGDDYNKY